jgi:hypothetical protein
MKNIFQKSNMKTSGVNAIIDFTNTKNLHARERQKFAKHSMKNSALSAIFQCFFAAILLASPAFSASFVQPTVSGTTPSGLLWSDVATGLSLPLRTTTAGMNGTTGAVAYFNTQTGVLQIDPKGLSLTTFIFTYATGNSNVSASTPGPFVYPTGNSTNAISPTTGTPRTFPAVTAVTGLAPTTFMARVGMVIGAPLGPALATSGDPGNIASSNGYFNQPWAFPSDLVDPVSLSSMVISDFYTVG